MTSNLAVDCISQYSDLLRKEGGQQSNEASRLDSQHIGNMNIVIFKSRENSSFASVNGNSFRIIRK